MRLHLRSFALNILSLKEERNLILRLRTTCFMLSEGGTMKIIGLYDFDLYICKQKETYQEKAMFEYRHHNIFYAGGKDSGIKYSWNQGHINIDNPKIAVRYFLNAIDRVETLKGKYEKELQELNQNIPMLEKIVEKPFDKEDELAQLKKDVLRLEREITIKIQEDQMNQQEIAETPVVKMEAKSLLPKKNLVKKSGTGVKL